MMQYLSQQLALKKSFSDAYIGKVEKQSMKISELWENKRQ